MPLKKLTLFPTCNLHGQNKHKNQQQQQQQTFYIVNKFDRHNHTFIVTETQASLQTPKPPRRVRVILQSQNCDCGEHQTKYLICSHIMAACKSVNVDPMNYVPLFTL